MNYLEATQTLAESFNALAEQVQSLIDRKTILEHKLRYAHEQVFIPDFLVLSPVQLSLSMTKQIISDSLVLLPLL